MKPVDSSGSKSWRMFDRDNLLSTLGTIQCFGIPQNDYGDLSLLAAAKSALALAPKPM